MRIDVVGNETHAATGGVALDGERAELPAVVLIHGAGMDSSVWQNQTRFLAHRGLRAVAVDLPGHGGSSGEPLTSIAEMADWIADFAAAAGLAESTDGPGLHLVGHSMGAMVALETARRHSNLVRSLTLMGAADAMPVHPELISSSADALDRAAALMAAWSHGRSAHIGSNPVPGMWMLGGARALVENSRSGVLTVDFNACADYGEATAAMAAASVPTTILVGAEDKMTPPKAAAKLAEAGGDDVTVTAIAGVGHSMMAENPRAVRGAILAAVRAAEAAASSGAR